MNRRRVKSAAAEVASDTIVINDVGPVEHLEIFAPPGEIVVLTGRNGAGKTKVLEAIEALAGGKTKIESRDGTTGGYIEGLGVKIAVARGGSNRRRGELEVLDLEDKLRIADLIDPGLKDPLAADQRRIQSLVRLAGKRADFELFRPLLGPGWESYISPETIVIEDVVEMAAKLKREIEAKARAVEKECDLLEAEMTAKEAAIKDLDLRQPHDAVKLAADLDAATVAAARLDEKRTYAFQIRQRADQSKKAIEAAAENYKGMSVADAEAAYEAETKANNEARDTANKIAQQLKDANNIYNASLASLQHAADRLHTAKEHQLTIAHWQADVDTASANIECPSDDVVAEARERVELARMISNDGVRIRDGLKVKDDIELIGDTRDKLVDEAEKLRDAAGGTNDVLTRIVANMGCTLRVNKEFRLVTDTDRGETYYAELSHGERTRQAIDVVIGVFEDVGVAGILCLPQEFFESLDGDNVRAIQEQIKGRPITIFTAAADKGDEVGETVGAATLQ